MARVTTLYQQQLPTSNLSMVGEQADGTLSSSMQEMPVIISSDGFVFPPELEPGERAPVRDLCTTHCMVLLQFAKA